MANVITRPDGTNSILMDLRDFTYLMDQYMGYEAKDWLENYLAETYGEEEEVDAIIADYEKQLADLRGRYKEVMVDLRTEAEKLAGLICEKDLDRKAISNTAGRIGTITWREVNRR